MGGREVTAGQRRAAHRRAHRGLGLGVAAASEEAGGEQRGDVGAVGVVVGPQVAQRVEGAVVPQLIAGGQELGLDGRSARLGGALEDREGRRQVSASAEARRPQQGDRLPGLGRAVGGVDGCQQRLGALLLALVEREDRELEAELGALRRRDGERAGLLVDLRGLLRAPLASDRGAEPEEQPQVRLSCGGPAEGRAQERLQHGWCLQRASCPRVRDHGLRIPGVERARKIGDRQRDRGGLARVSGAERIRRARGGQRVDVRLEAACAALEDQGLGAGPQAALLSSDERDEAPERARREPGHAPRPIQILAPGAVDDRRRERAAVEERLHTYGGGVRRHPLDDEAGTGAPEARGIAHPHPRSGA